jgi:hypothetical protein
LEKINKKVKALKTLITTMKMLKEMVDDPKFYELKGHTYERLSFIHKKLSEVFDDLTLAD